MSLFAVEYIDALSKGVAARAGPCTPLVRGRPVYLPSQCRGAVGINTRHRAMEAVGSWFEPCRMRQRRAAPQGLYRDGIIILS